MGDFESSSYRVSGGYGFGFNDWLVGARLNLYIITLLIVLMLI